METALAFPEPLPDDPEVVATALETAGIFGVQGDVREAVRWVRRAAELAGDAGIDDRAFALARAAADLTSNYSVSSAPPPAPAPTAAQPAQPDGAAARIASAPPPPPPPPPAAQNRPQESRPPQQAVSVSPIVSLGSSAAPAAAAPSEEEGEITSQHPPHRARTAESTPPVQRPPAAPQQAQAPAAPQQAQAAAPPRADALAALFEEPLTAQPSAPAPAAPRPGLSQTLAYRSPAPEPTPSELTPEVEAKFEEPATPVPPVAPAEPTVRYPASEPEPSAGQRQATPTLAEAPRYGQHLMATQVYEPVQPEATFVEEPVPVMEATVAGPEPAVPSVASSASARQAVRASVEQSQEEGVYILRLLKNGEAAVFGTSEALVVLVDPEDELFTGA